MKITSNERAFLQAIVDSDFNDTGDPVGNDVWLDSVEGWSAHAKAGTVSSLVKKGLIVASRYVEPRRFNPNTASDETVAITSDGMEALR